MGSSTSCGNGNRESFGYPRKEKEEKEDGEGDLGCTPPVTAREGNEMVPLNPLRVKHSKPEDWKKPFL